MKCLAITAAALLLLGAPAAFAQSDNSGTSAGSGTNAADGAGNNGGSTSTAGTGGGANDSSQCSDETATSSYGSFSEKCRGQIDAWAASQTGKSVSFEGDVAVGTVVPDSVEIIEVPAYHNYGYVMLNDHRVLVDRTTHKVVRVY